MTRPHGVAWCDWSEFVRLYNDEYDRLAPDEDEWVTVEIEDRDTV
jgi:hypothetical protein